MCLSRFSCLALIASNFNLKTTWKLPGTIWCVLEAESKSDLVSQKAWLASVTGMTLLLMTPSTLYLQCDEKSSEIIWRAYKQGPDPMLSKKKKKKENSFKKTHTPKKENSSQEWKFKQCWSPVAPPITLTLLIFLELLEKDPSPAKIKLFVQPAWKADLWNTFSFPALRDGHRTRDWFERVQCHQCFSCCRDFFSSSAGSQSFLGPSVKI